MPCKTGIPQDNSVSCELYRTFYVENYVVQSHELSGALCCYILVLNCCSYQACCKVATDSMMDVLYSNKCTTPDQGNFSVQLCSWPLNRDQD